MYSRRSRDGSVTPTQDNRDVFDDEFAVDDFDMVADGFRPDSSAGEEHHSQDPPIHTASAHYSSNPDLTTAPVAPSRNSISKTRSHENPFASPDDEPRLEFERSPSIHSQSTASFAPGIARRSTSSASSHAFAGTQSPRFGTGGPSHPYAMYPQGTMARSPSIATTSTIQPHRTSTLSQAPQHPYGMYPQGVAEDDDLDLEDDAPAVAPVGFPGREQTYQRVRGPDGEEQDIIGSDGHTEQLPPYTRYPEDGPKMPILAVPGELHSRGPVAGSDPGMPLMHQHIPPPNPPPVAPQSMTDQSNMSRHSMQDRGVDQHAALPLMERSGSQSTGYTEKSWKAKSWKEKRKTKFCGVPLLWLIIAICVAGFIGAVVGGTVSGYASGSKHAKEKSDAESSSSSSALEASRVATPTIAPPSGTYALSLSTATNVASGCLTNSADSQAWDCDLVGSPALAISVGVPAAPRPTDGAFFFYASSDPTYEYGAQFKFMDTDFASFQTWQEADEEDKGPAFYFRQKYDKIVMLPQNAIPPRPTSTPKSKRDFQMPKGFGTKRQKISSGEKPWQCVWNDTLIEGWIYVEQNITSSFPITTSSQSFSMPTANSTPSEAAPSTFITSTPTAIVSGDPVKIDTFNSVVSSPSSGSRYTTTVTSTKTSLTTTPSSEPWPKNRGPPGNKFDNTDDDITQTAAQKRVEFPPPEDTLNRRDEDEVDDDDDDEDGLTEEQEELLDTYHGLPGYPYLIKIEERRLPDESSQPYCRQMQLLENGYLAPLGNGIDDEYMYWLDESPPAYTAYDDTDSVSYSEKLRAKKRSPPSGACHCEWWTQ